MGGARASNLKKLLQVALCVAIQLFSGAASKQGEKLCVSQTGTVTLTKQGPLETSMLGSLTLPLYFSISSLATQDNVMLCAMPAHHSSTETNKTLLGCIQN